MPTSAEGDRSSRGRMAQSSSLWSFSSALSAGQNATPNPIKLGVTLYLGRAQQAATPHRAT